MYFYVHPKLVPCKIFCPQKVNNFLRHHEVVANFVTLYCFATGIMTLQRRLSGMERDLAAIQAKLNSLEKEAASIEGEHPEEAAVIRERIVQIQIVWEQLTQMLKERDAKLEEAGDLHRFLRDLDHFQVR